MDFIFSQDQHKWDAILLKCQVTKFSFGIPGESQCFECQQQFDDITDRFVHEFHNHSKGCERMSYEESKKIIKFADFHHRSCM